MSPRFADATKIALFAALYAVFFLHMIGSAPAPFVIDEALYIAMTDAFAARGDLAVQTSGVVDGAGPLSIALTAVGADGRVYPQYPAGFGIIASPLYALSGVYGLFLLEAASGLAAIFLTAKIARRLYNDDRVAAFSALLFAGATYFSTYAFSIWPHMLATAMLLGAALAAIIAVEDGRVRPFLLALSGALIAAAMTVRVDSVLCFAAVFLWLRLFAAPRHRLASVWFLAGAAPIVAWSTMINFEKFGVPSPISYGGKSGHETLAGYLPMALCVVAAMVPIMVFDLAAAVRSAWRARPRTLLLLIVAIALAALLTPVAARLLRNFWTILFDIQTYDGDFHHDVLIRDAGGFLTTFGLPKKAFLESMPFLAIALLPAIDFLRGREVRAASLCLLLAAAPIVFFGLKQWHGGYSLNMRFLSSAVPFLAILSAKAILGLKDGKGFVPRDGLPVVAGCAALLFLQWSILSLAPALGVPAVTWPQLAIALVLLAGAACFAVRPAEHLRGALSGLALFSVGASAASNFGDYELTTRLRAHAAHAATYFAGVIPVGSLVISLDEAKLISAMIRGVSLYHPDAGKPDELASLVRRFDEAGRCVYVRQGEIAAFSERAAGVRFVSAAAAPPEGLDWLATLHPVRPGCALR